jgi:hypothetical protein
MSIRTAVAPSVLANRRRPFVHRRRMRVQPRMYGEGVRQRQVRLDTGRLQHDPDALLQRPRGRRLGPGGPWPFPPAASSFFPPSPSSGRSVCSAEPAAGSCLCRGYFSSTALQGRRPWPSGRRSRGPSTRSPFLADGRGRSGPFHHEPHRGHGHHGRVDPPSTRIGTRTRSSQPPMTNG